MAPPRIRVLLFEDYEAVRQVLTDYIESLGFTVVAASEPLRCPVYNGGVCGCEQGSMCGDIVLTDIDMPRMTGLELVRRQRENGCALPPENVAVMSGDWSQPRLEEARALGCHVFPKPLSLEDLRQWLETCRARIPEKRRLRDV